MRIIAGIARGRRIDAPAGSSTRPTLDRVRENLFNMLQQEVPGSFVLDLFAGSGALSLEALSRGAEHAVVVDHDRNAIAVEKKNISALGFSDKTTVLHMDWQAAVRKMTAEGMRFHLTFLDPPYAMKDMHTVFQSLKPLLYDNGIVVLERMATNKPEAEDGYEIIRSREWGYCGVTIFRGIEQANEKEE